MIIFEFRYIKPNFNRNLYHMYHYMCNLGKAFEIKCLIYEINGIMFIRFDSFDSAHVLRQFDG